MKWFQKVFVVALLALSGHSFAASKLLLNVPHYHEFNSAQNPNGYGFCGHTALKITAQYVTGQVKTLQQIHSPLFWNNSYAYRTNQNCGSNGFLYCASLLDLWYGVQQTNANSINYGYNRPNSVKYVYANNKPGFYQKIKDGIDNGWPVIVPSSVYYGDVGHFWVVVGYSDGSSSSGHIVYVRDVAQATPTYQYAYGQSVYDKSFSLDSFYAGTANGQLMIIK